MTKNFDLYLASASPRRLQLITSVGLDVEVMPANIAEVRCDDESALDFVQRLAVEKAEHVAARLSVSSGGLDAPVLAADTIVLQGEEVFGKPRDEVDALRIWQQLSDRKHQVMTAMALVDLAGEVHQAVGCTDVEFAALNAQQMHAYWQSGEPADKAGGYAIQGLASAWVTRISGSYSNVVGLPLFELNNLLKAVQLNWL